MAELIQGTLTTITIKTDGEDVLHWGFIREGEQEAQLLRNGCFLIVFNDAAREQKIFRDTLRLSPDADMTFASDRELVSPQWGYNEHEEVVFHHTTIKDFGKVNGVPVNIRDAGNLNAWTEAFKKNKPATIVV